MKFKADGAITGDVAIWTGSDDAPFSNPLANLNRVKFHSALDYPKVIYEWSDNVDFPARTQWMPGLSGGSGAWGTTENVRVATHNLFAHGRGGQPWVLGSVRIDGTDVAFTGSVPVQLSVVSNSSDGAASWTSPWARWVTLGADSTNVLLFEYCPVSRWNSGGNANMSLIYMPQVTRLVTVWVTDEILS